MANKNPMAPEPMSAELNSRLVTAALKLASWPSIDLHDIDAVRQRTEQYFHMCDTQGLRPSNLGYYASLGLSKQDVSEILTGKRRGKVTPAVADFIQKTKYALSSYREQLALLGKASPPIAIFWAKNFDGMEDTTRLDVSRADYYLPTASMTPEQIEAELQKRIETDIPIEDYDNYTAEVHNENELT